MDLVNQFMQNLQTDSRMIPQSFEFYIIGNETRKMRLRHLKKFRFRGGFDDMKEKDGMMAKLVMAKSLMH